MTFVEDWISFIIQACNFEQIKVVFHVSRTRDAILVHCEMALFFVLLITQVIWATNHISSCLFIQISEQRNPVSISLILYVQCTLDRRAVGEFLDNAGTIDQFLLKIFNLCCCVHESIVYFIKLFVCIVFQSVTPGKFTVNFVHEVCKLLFSFLGEVFFGSLK